MKLTDQQMKLIVWVVAIAAVTVLIALGKLPAEALKYALLYAAGTLGGSLKVPGLSGGTDASTGQPGASNGPNQTGGQ